MARSVFPVLLALAYAVPAASSETGFQLEQIDDGVYVHYGSHHTIEHADRGDIANIGVVVGPDCIAVIDSGGSVTTGQQLRRAISTISDKPVCYVITTHIHFDHILGNSAFADTGAAFAGHWQLPEEILLNQDFFKQDFAAEAGETELPTPDVTVQNTMEISLGQGRTLELRAWSAAHTHSDLTVLDHASGTIFTGDLVFRERTPVIDGKLLGWIEVMSGLRDIQVQRIVPGHGSIAANWDEAMGDQLRYLQSLRDEVRAAIAAGAFMEDVIATAGQTEKGNWQLFDDVHGRNVSKAFIELEWE